MKTVPIWCTAPFIRFVIAFIAGIIIEWNVQLLPNVIIIILGICTLFSCIYFFTNIGFRYRFALLNGACFIILIVCFGICLLKYQTIQIQNNSYQHYYQPGDGLVVYLLETPIVKGQAKKANASIDYLYRNGKKLKVKGNIIIYFSEDLLQPIKNGDEICFMQPLHKIQNAGNPGEFNYAGYMGAKGFFDEVYLRQNQYIILNQKKSIENTVIQPLVYNDLLNIIKKSIHEPEARAMTEDLLLGYKNDLDENTIETYSSAGLMHILNISGLRLGYIYLFILSISTFLSRRPYGNIVRYSTILIFLWLYYFLFAGHSSILRTTILLSFVAISEMLERRVNPFNSLAAAVVILLCYNPFWLFDIGFQLSVLSIISIRVFFAPIYKSVKFRNSIVDHVWKIFSGSMAVQILILPLSAYYFHHLSFVSLIGNIICIPISAIIWFFGCFIVIFHSISWITLPASSLIILLVHFMNSFTEHLQVAGRFVDHAFYPNVFETILILLFIILICYWFFYNKIFLLWAALGTLLICVSYQSIILINAGFQKQIVIYNVSKYNCIGLINGRSFLLIKDPKIKIDRRVKSIIDNSLAYYHINTTFEPQNEHYFKFLNKQVLIIDTNVILKDVNETRSIDFLILSGKPSISITTLINHLHIKNVIMLHSINRKDKMWIKECDSLRIPYHIISEKGAMTIDCNSKMD